MEFKPYKFEAQKVQRKKGKGFECKQTMALGFLRLDGVWNQCWKEQKDYSGKFLFINKLMD